MVEVKYRFSLRSDLPPGFIENINVPELPAAGNFLREYDGKNFSLEEFRRELSKFGDYLVKNKVPRGIDEEVRGGIFVFEGPARYVGTYNDSPSRKCIFGALELVIQNN